MNVSYHEEWELGEDNQKVWKFFHDALIDSTQVEGWPNNLVILNAQTKSLTSGSLVEARYKMGLWRIKAHYIVEEVRPFQKLSYRTGPQHLLKGASEINFWKFKDKTICQWKGHYSGDKLNQYLGLVWFKTYYQKRFFSQLKLNTTKMGLGSKNQNLKMA